MSALASLIWQTKCSLPTLKPRSAMLVGSLAEFIEFGGGDRETEIDVKISEATPLATLR
jgi:hypothetical protein